MKSRDKSPLFLFAVDSKTKRGRVVCHMVRFETYEFTGKEFDGLKFELINAEKDSRFSLLAEVLPRIGG